jgi:hypothetical protein
VISYIRDAIHDLGAGVVEHQLVVGLEHVRLYQTVDVEVAVVMALCSTCVVDELVTIRV